MLDQILLWETCFFVMVLEKFLVKSKWGWEEVYLDSCAWITLHYIALLTSFCWKRGGKMEAQVNSTFPHYYFPSQMWVKEERTHLGKSRKKGKKDYKWGTVPVIPVACSTRYHKRNGWFTSSRYFSNLFSD